MGEKYGEGVRVRWCLIACVRWCLIAFGVRWCLIAFGTPKVAVSSASAFLQGGSSLCSCLVRQAYPCQKFPSMARAPAPRSKQIFFAEQEPFLLSPTSPPPPPPNLPTRSRCHALALQQSVSLHRHASFHSIISPLPPPPSLLFHQSSNDEKNLRLMPSRWSARLRCYILRSCESHFLHILKRASSLETLVLQSICWGTLFANLGSSNQVVPVRLRVAIV